jgi:hypothetical protein
MLHGHDWSSSERTSHTPSERRRMLRMPRIVWFVVLLLWLSLCGLSLSYVVRYIRNQFPPPTPTPIVSIATTPTPAPSPIPSPSPSPTPSPTSTPVTPTVVSGRTDHYIGLILKNEYPLDCWGQDKPSIWLKPWCADREGSMAKGQPAWPVRSLPARRRPRATAWLVLQ